MFEHIDGGQKGPEDIFHGVDASPSTAPVQPPPIAAPESPSNGSKKWVIIIGIVLVLVAGVFGGTYLFTALRSPDQSAKVTPSVNNATNSQVATTPTPTVPVTSLPAPVIEPTTVVAPPLPTSDTTNVVTTPAPEPVAPVSAPRSRCENNVFTLTTVEPLDITNSDSDGLTDTEEVLTYKTNPCNTDTDGDGFSDGREVCSGYNPLGSGKLPADLPVKKNCPK